MGRPKKYVRPQIRRKCNQCGKMKTNPFIYHIVPEYKNIMEIPTYSRTAQKTPRIDLKGDRELTYTLVSPEEADFEQGKISTVSPIGKGLLGHEAGEEIEIQVPAGRLHYKIVSISR